MEPDARTSVGMPPRRLLILADGIFAIAMTLLVLDLRLPDASTGSLAMQLAGLGGAFLTFVISFVVLGVFWFAHHQTFHFVVRITEHSSGSASSSSSGSPSSRSSRPSWASSRAIRSR